MYNALRVLARLALQMNEPDKANSYAEQAMNIARASGNHVDEIYPSLFRGKWRRGAAIAPTRNKYSKQSNKIRVSVFLKWEAQHSLARLYEEKSNSAS